jgi:hypothetical protein
MQYGGVAGDPSYDMGLETNVTAQQAIQSALSEGVDLGGPDEPRQGVRLPSTIKPRAQGRRFTGITSINLPGYAGKIARNLENFVRGNKGVQPFFESLPGGGLIGGIIPFQDGGFVDDLEGDPSDYGMTQEDFDTATSIGQATFSGNQDNIAQAIANAVAQPQVGRNRSNIIDSVDAQGRNMYDPQFAAALDIQAGLDPSYNFGGIGGLTVPSYLRPQIQGDFDSEAANANFSEADMVRPMFNSRGEQVLQQYLPGIVKQGMDMGIMGLARKAGDYFKSNFSKLFGNSPISPEQRKRTDIQ